MRPFTEGDPPDANLVRHSHWAVGYVDGYEIRVFDAKGDITPAFKAWAEIRDSLEGYGILDESIYSEMQDEEMRESWRSFGARDFRKVLSGFQPSIAGLLERSSDEILWDLWYVIAKETDFVEAFVEESDGVFFPLDRGCLTTAMKGKAIREELTRLRRQPRILLMGLDHIRAEPKAPPLQTKGAMISRRTCPDACDAWLAGPRVRIDSLPLNARVLSMTGDRGVIVGSLVKLVETFGVRGDCPVVRLDGGRVTSYAGCAEVVVLP